MQKAFDTLLKQFEILQKQFNQSDNKQANK